MGQPFSSQMQSQRGDRMSLRGSLGRTARLTVVRKAPFGWFLTGAKEEVLLHINETDREWQEGEEAEVFLYTDSQGRIAATTFIPAIQAGTYGWGKVKEVREDIGVFVDIGINKDMLLGAEDLPVRKSAWPKPGDWLYITLKVSRNGRIYVKLASDEVIEEKRNHATRKDFNKKVQGCIYRTAKAGSWVFTFEGYKGFIHESQRGKEPRLGEKVDGRIIDVKEDGTVNISLLPRKHESMADDAERIYSYLLERNGAMPYSDKSPPEDIRARFGMSKGAFKRALGKLMKEGKVYQEGMWTYAVKKE